MDNLQAYDYDDIRYSSGLSKQGYNQDASQYATFSTLEILINWVNSYEYPNCLLASQMSDFKDGIIFCELVNEIVLKNQIPDFLPKIFSNEPNYDEKLHNATMALSEIKSMRDYAVPQSIKEFKSLDLLQDENKIMTLLKFLYDLANDKIPMNRSSTQSSAKKVTLQPPLEQNYISDSLHNRSDMLSNNSTQPSPISSLNGPKMPQKPPLNPGISKMKSPTNMGIPKKNEKMTHQSPRQFDESPIPNEPQERDTFSDVDTNQNYYPTMAGGKDQHKISSDLYQQYFAPQNDYKFQQNMDYSPEFVSSSPHYIDGQDSGVMVNDFSNTEMVRPLAPNEQYAATRKRNSKNNSKSVSKYEPGLTDQYSNFLDKSAIEMERSPSNSEKHIYTPISQQGQNRFMFNPESQRSDQTSSMRGPYFPNEQNEFRIMPMEVQQRRVMNPREAIEEYEYDQAEELQQIRNDLYNQQRRKSKSQQHHPSPQAPEVNPSTYLNPGDKKLQQQQQQQQQQQKKSENKDIPITPCPDETKKKLLNWLCSIGLLKENIKGLDKKLPKICKNGLLFSDVINRLEGKNETIKGITRNSKSRSQINSNYHKVLEYLRGYEKMNPRYLQAQEYLVDGNEDAFWGFLDDIWHFYNNKISQYDPRYKVTKEKFKPKMIAPKPKKEDAKQTEQSRISNHDLSYNDICCYNNPPPVGTVVTREASSPAGNRDKNFSNSKQPQNIKPAIKKPEILEESTIIHHEKDEGFSHYHEEERSPKAYDWPKSHHENAGGLRTKHDNSEIENKMETYNYSPKAKNNIGSTKGIDNSTPSATNKSMNKRGTTHSVGSPSYFQNYQVTQENSQIMNEDQCISLDVEILVTEWLKQMGFKALLMREKSTLFDDPFRNGTLLCYVIGRVENERMHGIYKEPKSIDECRYNVYKAFQVLRRKHIPIPSFLNGREESILKGNRSTTLTLLYSLMKTHKTKSGTSLLTNSTEKAKYEISGDIPPYSEQEIEELEESLINWLDSLGLLQGINYKPASVRELSNHLKNGVILCDLATLVTGEKLGSIHRRPTTESHYVTNIRKALETLKNKKGMGQKYLWKEKEILKGNKYVVLGLLEDIHRVYDGQPPRKNPNYFTDGPYIPKTGSRLSIRNGDMQEDYYRERNKAALFESALNHSNFGRLNTSAYNDNNNTNNSRTMTREAVTSASYIASQPYDERRDKASILNISSDEPISLIPNSRKGGLISAPGTNTSSYRALDERSSPFETLKNSSYISNMKSSPNSKREKNPNSSKALRVSFTKDVDEKSDFTNRSQLNTEKNVSTGALIKEWLISLGFIDLIRTIDFDGDTIEDMKDGIILCKILEKLEMREIPGVILKPRTNASRMVNIRKCLNVLSKRPGINPHYLHCEDKILAGDGATIRRLLSSIKEAYKFVNKCVTKSHNRSSSRNLDTSIGEQRGYNQSENYEANQSSDNFYRNASERKRLLIPTPNSKY